MRALAKRRPPRRARSTAAALGATLGLSTACGSDEGPAVEAVAIRDSAGVRIVTSSRPAWTESTAWRLSGAPAVSIGVMDGAAEEQLFRVTDAAVLSDGRILVGNSGTSELRVFDPTGEFSHSLGGDGEGPGEFRMIRQVDVTPGDSVFAWDLRLRRLSVFTPDDFVRTMQLTPPAESTFPSFAGTIGASELLVQVPAVVPEEDLVDLAIRGSSSLYMRYTTAGEPVDTLGVFRGSRSMLRFHEDGLSLSVLGVPYEPATRIASGGGTVVEGDGATFEVRRYDGTGRLRQILRRPVDRRPVTPELMDAHFEDGYGAAEPPEYRRGIREAYDAMPVEGNVAAFDQLVLSRDGTVWVREYAIPGAETHAWSVFDPEGVWLGDVSVPAGLTVYDVGADYVLGKEVDDLDIERVVLYRIEGPGAGP